jgi:peptide/nickel transport system permease protein
MGWFPVQGWSDDLWKNFTTYAPLPILLGLLVSIAPNTRLFRSFVLDEVDQDYVRTARAKGLSESRVLFVHVLRNALIPILSASVAVIPLLFMGSLITESFFAIPGLGSYLIEAIAAQDFAVVRAMVFIGSVLYIVGLILTDISYSLADPRIRLQ